MADISRLLELEILRCAFCAGPHPWPSVHSFLSPIANRRIDSYGCGFANRMRYPFEVAAAIHEVWPRQEALGMRITGADWVDGGITPEEAGTFAGKLSDIGFD